MAAAASGGTAVISAVGTDAWTSTRTALGRWFGRGDVTRERVELERLDRTASELQLAAAENTAHVATGEEYAWKTRIADLLESLPEDRRAQAAEDLRSILNLQEGATSGGITFTGNTFSNLKGAQFGNHGSQTNNFG